MCFKIDCNIIADEKYDDDFDDDEEEKKDEEKGKIFIL